MLCESQDKLYIPLLKLLIEYNQDREFYNHVK